MNKQNILRVLSLVGKATAIGGFAASWLPAEKAALLFAATSGIKEIAIIIGDYFDDGEKNDSFKG